MLNISPWTGKKTGADAPAGYVAIACSWPHSIFTICDHSVRLLRSCRYHLDSCFSPPDESKAVFRHEIRKMSGKLGSGTFKRGQMPGERDHLLAVNLLAIFMLYSHLRSLWHFTENFTRGGCPKQHLQKFAFSESSLSQIFTLWPFALVWSLTEIESGLQFCRGLSMLVC